MLAKACDLTFLLSFYSLQFTGIGILIMGAILAGQSDYVSLIGYQEFDICIVMIVAGAITTLVCALGWFGALRRNTTVLFTVSIYY